MAQKKLINTTGKTLNRVVLMIDFPFFSKRYASCVKIYKTHKYLVKVYKFLSDP